MCCKQHAIKINDSEKGVIRGIKNIKACYVQETIVIDNETNTLIGSNVVNSMQSILMVLRSVLSIDTDEQSSLYSPPPLQESCDGWP